VNAIRESEAVVCTRYIAGTIHLQSFHAAQTQTFRRSYVLNYSLSISVLASALRM